MKRRWCLMMVGATWSRPLFVQNTIQKNSQPLPFKHQTSLSIFQKTHISAEQKLKVFSGVFGAHQFLMLWKPHIPPQLRKYDIRGSWTIFGSCIIIPINMLHENGWTATSSQWQHPRKGKPRTEVKESYKDDADDGNDNQYLHKDHHHHIKVALRSVYPSVSVPASSPLSRPRTSTSPKPSSPLSSSLSTSSSLQHCQGKRQAGDRAESITTGFNRKGVKTVVFYDGRGVQNPKLLCKKQVSILFTTKNFLNAQASLEPTTVSP